MLIARHSCFPPTNSAQKIINDKDLNENNKLTNLDVIFMPNDAIATSSSRLFSF